MLANWTLRLGFVEAPVILTQFPVSVSPKPCAEKATWNTGELGFNFVSVCTGEWSRYPGYPGLVVPHGLLSGTTIEQPVRWTTNVLGPPEFAWCVAKFAPHKALKLIAWREGGF